MSLNPTARPSSRTVMTQLVVRLVLTVIFPLLQNTPRLKWVLIIVYLVGCSVVALMYTWVCCYQ
jgi:hypothetical protein